MKYKTKHKEGFTRDEMIDLVENHTNYNLKDFWEKLGDGNTGMMINNDFITFTSDVELALRLLKENRNMNSFEFD